MALAPRAPLTSALASRAEAALTPLCLLYLALLFTSWSPDTMSVLLPGSLAEGLSAGRFNPQFFPALAGVAELFSRPATAASLWVHLLVINLFAARSIWARRAAGGGWGGRGGGGGRQGGVGRLAARAGRRRGGAGGPGRGERHGGAVRKGPAGARGGLAATAASGRVAEDIAAATDQARQAQAEQHLVRETQGRMRPSLRHSGEVVSVCTALVASPLHSIFRGHTPLYPPEPCPDGVRPPPHPRRPPGHSLRPASLPDQRAAGDDHGREG